MDKWIPLMEYAVRSGKSISTLRRYIKSDKINFRLVDGKYFIADSASEPVEPITTSPVVSDLKEELRHARKEIAELKMLVSVYEDQFTGHG